MKAIINSKIIINEEIIENKIIVFDEKIIDISDKIPAECEIIDAKGLYTSPGLIDIHIHGSNNYDVMDNEEENIKIIGESICKNGVTSFLPTTMTMDKESIYKALEKIRASKNKNYGAKILGAHVEGPFINPKYRGAQDEKYIIPPDYEFIKPYIDCIKIISYAPEMDIDFKFTQEIKKSTDIVLSIAHTNATYNQGTKAMDMGTTNITHLFNAMTPLHHRDPGIAGLGLTTDIYTEMIADNIHITPQLYQFIINAKKHDKLILITDSMRGANMDDGEYNLGGQKVYIKNNEARLITDNSLAGSVLTLNKAVKNIHENTDINLAQAIKLASLNPATLIGVSDQKGSLEINKDADIVLFDEDMNCYMTIVEGEIVYKK